MVSVYRVVSLFVVFLAFSACLPPLQTSTVYAQPKINAEVMQPSLALEDKVLGDPDAPIVLIEYASVTCPACKRFHDNVLPHLKKKYVDTGKVKLIFRDFPLSQLSIAISMLARCSSKTDKEFFENLSVLFGAGERVLTSQFPLDELYEVGSKRLGLSDASFKKCMSDRDLLENILSGREVASKRFGISRVPTFFINGNNVGYFHSTERLDEVMRRYLGPPKSAKVK